MSRVKKIDRLIENKLIEKEQWRSIAEGTSGMGTGERVQSSGSQQKMADAVLKMIEIETEIDAYVDSLIYTKKETIDTIEQLESTEYDLLHKIYIQGKELDEAAESCGKTYSWATTTHGRALKNLQTILNERSSKT